MTTDTLETAMRALADAQRAQDNANNEVEIAVAAVRATPEGRAWAAAVTRFDAARQIGNAAERDARAAILAAYEATGDKHPAPGAGVRVSTGKLTITDDILALAWAEEHMPAAVLKTVDAALLAAWAASQPELPAWMTRTPYKATPTIASNLTELYPEA